MIVLIAIAVAFLAWAEQTGQQELQALLAKMEAERATLLDLIPRPIPADENAAPLYDQTFAVLAKDEPPGMPSLEGVAANGERVRAYLEKNHDALEKLRQAVERKKCRFKLDYDQGFAMQLPHLSKLRSCARLLAWDALHKRHQGDLSGAVESCRAAWRVGAALSEEPILISFLVECTCDGIAASATRQVVDQADLPAELLNTLLLELTERRFAPDRLSQCLKMERAMAQGIFEQVRTDPKTLAALDFQVPGGQDGRHLLDRA